MLRSWLRCSSTWRSSTVTSLRSASRVPSSSAISAGQPLAGLGLRAASASTSAWLDGASASASALRGGLGLGVGERRRRLLLGLGQELGGVLGASRTAASAVRWASTMVRAHLLGRLLLGGAARRRAAATPLGHAALDLGLDVGRAGAGGAPPAALAWSMAWVSLASTLVAMADRPIEEVVDLVLVVALARR